MSKSKIPSTTSRKMPADWLAHMRQPPPHPGVYFREIRQGQASPISTRAAAARMGISNNRLNEIELGQRSVTPETAVLFEAMTGISAETWCKLQMHHDLWHAMQVAKKIKRLLPGEPFPSRTDSE